MLPFLYSLLLLAPVAAASSPETGNDAVKEAVAEISDTLSGAVTVSSYKQVLPVGRLASPVTSIEAGEMDERGIEDIRKLSSIVPNLHIPDYGSSMTSTIYLRGFGSRMENPVMGLYIDDIPVLNKNSYDISLYDISSAMLLRGPQATLYGRNSMSGVLVLNTLSPETFHGSSLRLEYGNANTVSAKLSVYGSSGVGATVSYRHTDGFYFNTYDGKYVDRSDALDFRLRAWKRLRANLEFENVFSVNLTGQGGYPYREYDSSTGSLAPISYNDRCGYRRLSASEGMKFKYMAEDWTLSSVTSLQFLADDMDMDQDFTSRSMFTLSQVQKEGAVTQELVLKPEAGWRRPWWNWQTGFFGFAKYNDMSAPVRFKQDGISDLILANANKGLQAAFGGDAALSLQEDEFDITSDFGVTVAGAAIYHESYFTVGRWLFTAGLRLDYEWTGMDYDSGALMHYSLRLPFMTTDFIPVECSYKGYEDVDYLEIMPRISAMYDSGPVKLFATFSEGYRSGGFNTQIFSDIVQNMLMQEMMKDAPVRMPESSVGADDTVYRPEKSMNAEIGARTAFSSGSHRFDGTLSLYSIMCIDQQQTVFPSGQSTGRMMTNTGKSRSLGVEAAFSYSFADFSLSAAYGYCDARFVDYDDGMADYSGHRIPYAPEHTLNLYAGYRWNFRNGYFRGISVGADLSGAGRIWWNEDNSLYQPFYVLLGANARGHFKWFDIYLRGENLTGAAYNTFYFKSVGKSFFQRGKPLRLLVGVSVTL